MMRAAGAALLVAGSLIGSAYGAGSQAYTWNNVRTGGKNPDLMALFYVANRLMYMVQVVVDSLMALCSTHLRRA